MQIKITDAFCIAGEVQAVGTVLDVDKRLATELIYNNRAEKHVKPDAPIAEQDAQADATATDAAAAVPTKPAKANKESAQ